MRSEHVGYPIFGVSGLVNLGPAQLTPQWRNAKNAKSKFLMNIKMGILNWFKKTKKNVLEEMRVVLCFVVSETHPLFSEFQIVFGLLWVWKYSWIFTLLINFQSSWREQIVSTVRSSLHNHQCNYRTMHKTGANWQCT